MHMQCVRMTQKNDHLQVFGLYFVRRTTLDCIEICDQNSLANLLSTRLRRHQVHMYNSTIDPTSMSKHVIQAAVTSERMNSTRSYDFVGGFTSLK